MKRSKHYRVQLEPPTPQTGFSHTLRVSRDGAWWDMWVDPLLIIRTPDALSYSFEYIKKEAEWSERITTPWVIPDWRPIALTNKELQARDEYGLPLYRAAPASMHRLTPGQTY